MWLLYSIKKNSKGELRDQIVSRLRPNQTYVIIRNGKIDDEFQVSIETNNFPLSQVVDPKSRPEIRLVQTKTNKVEALIGDKTVRDNITLHDQDVIRISVNNIRFRIKWEDMAVFRDGPDDDEYHSMIEKASGIGFHVSRRWTESITHVWVSSETQSEVSHELLKGLVNRKYIISKNWLQDVFCKSVDLKFDSTVCYKTIKPIEWHNFGPLKQTVILDRDEKRKIIFKDLSFISFDSTQVRTLSRLIKACGGEMIPFDLDSRDEINLNEHTIIISPPNDSPKKNRWESFKKSFPEMPREIQEVEIGFAIMYSSTSQMCNPVASFGSFAMSSSANDSSKENYIMDKNSFSIRKDDKIEEQSDHNITRSMTPTVRYNSDSLGEEYSQNNALSEHDDIPEQSNRASPEKALSPVETTSPTEAMPPVENPSPTQAMSPIGDMSPPGALSPMDYDDDDENLPLLPSLNNIFDDFDIKSKPLPPPKTSKPPETPADINNTPFISTTTTSVVASSSQDSKAHEELTNTTPISHNNNYTTTDRLQRISRLSSRNTDSSSGFDRITRDSPRTSSPTPSIDARISPSLLASLENNSTSPSRISETVSNNHSLSNSPSSSMNTDSIDTLPTPEPINQSRKRVLPSSYSTTAKRIKTTENSQGQPETPTLETPTQMRYSTVVFAPLVVNPNPPPVSTRSSSGTNYKRFKKVKQFTDLNYLDVINMVNSSQAVREQPHSNNVRRPASRIVRLDDTSDFDPSLSIGVPRRSGW